MKRLIQMDESDLSEYWKPGRKERWRNSMLRSKWKLDLLESSSSPRSQDPLWKEIVIPKTEALPQTKGQNASQKGTHLQMASHSVGTRLKQSSTPGSLPPLTSTDLGYKENWSKLYPCVRVSQPSYVRISQLSCSQWLCNNHPDLSLHTSSTSLTSPDLLHEERLLWLHTLNPSQKSLCLKSLTLSAHLSYKLELPTL